MSKAVICQILIFSMLSSSMAMAELPYYGDNASPKYRAPLHAPESLNQSLDDYFAIDKKFNDDVKSATSSGGADPMAALVGGGGFDPKKEALFNHGRGNVADITFDVSTAIAKLPNGDGRLKQLFLSAEGIAKNMTVQPTEQYNFVIANLLVRYLEEPKDRDAIRRLFLSLAGQVDKTIKEESRRFDERLPEAIAFTVKVASVLLLLRGLKNENAGKLFSENLKIGWKGVVGSVRNLLKIKPPANAAEEAAQLKEAGKMMAENAKKFIAGKAQEAAAAEALASAKPLNESVLKLSEAETAAMVKHMAAQKAKMKAYAAAVALMGAYAAVDQFNDSGKPVRIDPVVAFRYWQGLAILNLQFKVHKLTVAVQDDKAASAEAKAKYREAFDQLKSEFDEFRNNENVVYAESVVQLRDLKAVNSDAYFDRLALLSPALLKDLTDINQQIKVFADAHGLLNPDDMGVSLGPIMGELNNLDVALPASVKPATASDKKGATCAAPLKPGSQKPTVLN